MRALQFYYDLDTRCENKQYAALLTSDNLINYTVSSVLSTPEIYEALYQRFYETERENISHLSLYLEESRSPEACGVPESLRLDQYGSCKPEY